MSPFFDVSAYDEGLKLFDFCHICWLLGIALISVILSFVFKKSDKNKKRLIPLFIAASMIITEIFRQTVLYCIGKSSVGYLPLHLCSINMFVCLFDSIKPNRFTREVLYAVCLPGTVMALLFPNWIKMPFWNFIHITSFVIHGLLFIYPVVLLFGGELKPDAKRLPAVLTVLVLGAVGMYFFNLRFGTNFWFVNRAGKGNPLTLFEEKFGNPGYLIAFPIFAAVIWLIMYLPWTIKKLCSCKSHKNIKEE